MSVTSGHLDAADIRAVGFSVNLACVYLMKKVVFRFFTVIAIKLYHPLSLVHCLALIHLTLPAFSWIEGLEERQRILTYNFSEDSLLIIRTPGTEHGWDIFRVHHEAFKECGVTDLNSSMQVSHIANLAAVVLWLFRVAAFFNFLLNNFRLWIPFTGLEHVRHGNDFLCFSFRLCGLLLNYCLRSICISLYFL